MKEFFFNLAHQAGPDVITEMASVALDESDAAWTTASRSATAKAAPPRSFASTDILELERRFNRLALGTQAMWELLREHYGLTEETLQAKILEIDLRDGRNDGKMTTLVSECPHCRAKTNSRRAACLMCGTTLPKAHAFEH